MKPKTKALLSALLRENSRASLISLWSDISSLNEQEFGAALDEISGVKPKPAKKPRKAPGLKGPADDKPVTRIAFHLRSKLGLADEQALISLREALLQGGVSEGRIPSIVGLDLETWLYDLLGHVPDSAVMTITKKMKR